MKNILPIVFALLVSTLSFGQIREFTLEDIIQRAKAQSPAAKAAETRKENSFWQYRVYKSDFNPQLRLSGAVPGYEKAFRQVIQPDASRQFLYVNEINSGINLGLEQNIPLTGGRVSINSSMAHYDIIGKTSEQPTFRGTPLNVHFEQPIFAFNRFKWAKRTEPMRYEESRREYVEQMEYISGLAVNRFFTYLEAQVNLEIAKFNLANNDTVFRIAQGRYNIGTTSRDNLLQVELQLLRSQQRVVEAKLALETSGLRLRSFIGLNDDEDFKLVPPDRIPDFEVKYVEALEHAKSYRSDYLGFERRRIEAEREIAAAKSQRFQANIEATFGLNNSGGTMTEIYQSPADERSANITFSLPILDWGRNKARMQTALANAKLTNYTIAQEELDFEQEIITQVRQFEVLRAQMQITKKSDEVAQERYDVAQNRYLIGKIDITNLNIALEEKDEAKTSYIKALRDFWTAYYNLRRLTLYDFVTGKRLYNPEE